MMRSTQARMASWISRLFVRLQLQPHKRLFSRGSWRRDYMKHRGSSLMPLLLLAPILLLVPILPVSILRVGTLSRQLWQQRQHRLRKQLLSNSGLLGSRLQPRLTTPYSARSLARHQEEDEEDEQEIGGWIFPEEDGAAMQSPGPSHRHARSRSAQPQDLSWNGENLQKY